jgi:hypothetical protein
MAGQDSALLSETDREACVTVHSRFEMDSFTAYRLKVAWSTALAALAVANDCPKWTVTYRVAYREAQRVLDLYFEEVETTIKI